MRTCKYRYYSQGNRLERKSTFSDSTALWENVLNGAILSGESTPRRAVHIEKQTFWGTYRHSIGHYTH